MDKYTNAICLFNQLVAKRKRHIKKLLCEFDLSALQGKIIYLLAHSEKHKQKVNAIAQEYSLDYGQLSRAITKMEKDKVIFFQNDLEDKRQKYIVLNKESLIVKSFKAKFWEQFNSEFRSLDQNEIIIFEKLLQRMVNSDDSINQKTN